ncbi:hypothetical protein KSP39_PZI011399 [Platanthera zijinensis]|uniref:Glucan endo-1,3-beta-D-glucosidase n=1 Tax=Platanthera zijinensis TaxID=2320716 RepID=A0AAP0BGV8_9ASPA
MKASCRTQPEPERKKKTVMERRGLLRLPFAVTVPLLFALFAVFAQGEGGIGVNYGLFDPNPDPLNALRNSGIGVILGSLNKDLQKFAGDPSAAASWVDANVVPYADTVDFNYIDIGNELIPGESASYVLPAMSNVAAAIRAAGLSILVTTAVSTMVLGTSYPPSQGAFSRETSQVMGPIVSFLASTSTPLLVNIYPFFAYSGDPENVRLDYSLFTTNDAVVRDSNLGYSNLFDAMVDSVYSALERVGGSQVPLVVSETGWPSAGGANGATVDNARIYNNNLVKHVNSKVGTPKRPGKELEVYMFAMFNENLKPEGTERNLGMFYPDMTEVYSMDF